MNRKILIEFDAPLAVGLSQSDSFEMSMRRTLLESRRNPIVYLLGRQFGKVVNQPLSDKQIENIQRAADSLKNHGEDKLADSLVGILQSIKVPKAL